jgi:hypothetical protein
MEDFSVYEGSSISRLGRLNSARLAGVNGTLEEPWRHSAAFPLPGSGVQDGVRSEALGTKRSTGDELGASPPLLTGFGCCGTGST